LIRLVYPDLRRLAASRLSGAGRITLAPTDLVHEAYLLLASQRSAWLNREQFFAIAARAMRRIVLDHVRERGRLKRGGDRQRVTLDTAILGGRGPSMDFMDLEQALDQLGEIDPECVRIVEMRFFAGMTTAEVSSALGASPSTIGRRWRFARAWLERELWP
jgi:RNA polymerase sigma factor (TIGR02999 family)